MKLSQFHNLIRNSDLDPFEQEEFIEACQYLDPEDLALFAEVFEDDPNTIRIMYTNYKAKQAALGAGNEEIWKSILREEEYQLDQLDKVDL